MRKIILLVIFLLGVEVCKVNASIPNYYLNLYTATTVYEVDEEYNPEVHKFTYVYGCIGSTFKEMVDGQLNGYIDTSIIGEYSVDVYLSFHNKCTGGTTSLTKSVKITVRDRTSPTIGGVKNHIVEYGSKLPDFYAGVFYYDNYSFSNDINFIVNASSVDETRLGQYLVYYTAIDESDNTTVEISTVTIVDTTSPSLSTPKSVTVDVNDYTFDFRNGATASDIHDGDITSRIEIDYKNMDIYTLGTYQIEYKVTDTSGNVASTLVTVNIVDRERPQINSVKEITVEYGTNLDEIDFIGNITITDNYYTDLELNYDITKVNINIVGDYMIAYYTIDGSGNISSVYSTVHVVDSVNPLIEVITDNIIVSVGDTGYDFSKHFVISDNYFENPTLSIDTSNVIFSSPGIYPVVATVTDYSGNASQVTVNITINGIAETPSDNNNADGANDNLGVNFNDYEAKDLSKIVKPLLILSIPVAGFVLAKSYLLKDH